MFFGLTASGKVEVFHLIPLNTNSDLREQIYAIFLNKKYLYKKIKKKQNA